MIPLLPIALLQIFVCLATAMFLGLPFNKSILFMILVLLIISPLYISCGLLFGTLFTDKQVGGIFAIFVNVTTWLSGTWFELDMIGGTFQKIAQLLPSCTQSMRLGLSYMQSMRMCFIHLLLSLVIQ